MYMMARLGYTIDGHHLGPHLKGILRATHKRLPKDETDQQCSSTGTSCSFEDSWQCFNNKFVCWSLEFVVFPDRCSDNSDIS